MNNSKKYFTEKGMRSSHESVYTPEFRPIISVSWIDSSEINLYFKLEYLSSTGCHKEGESVAIAKHCIENNITKVGETASALCLITGSGIK